MNAHSDRDALLRLWARNMSDQRIAAVLARRYQWLYEENPGGAPRTWLIISPAGEIVGCGSMIPREMRVDGIMLKGAVLADFAVDREHRSVGPAIQLQRAMLESVRGGDLDFVYGWPNDKSRGVIKRAGYEVAGESGLWTKVLRSHEQLLKRVRFSATLPGIALLLRVPAAMIDLATQATDSLRLLAGLLPFRSEILARADARFDELWARASREAIVGRRDAAYLNWRYADFTTAEYRFLLLTERGTGHRPVGYAVFSLQGGHAVLADFFCEDIARQMTPLLLRLARQVRRQGASQLSLNYIGGMAFADKLGRLQFFRRGCARAFIVGLRASAPEALKGSVSDCQRWFMFDGELDI